MIYSLCFSNIVQHKIAVDYMMVNSKLEELWLLSYILNEMSSIEIVNGRFVSY